MIEHLGIMPIQIYKIRSHLAKPNSEVWVAAGVYKPTTDGDRKISFQPTEFVQFYGGFAENETKRSQRDVEANQTTLSGNIGDLGDQTDNSYHVVDITGTSATTVLDGFIVRGGYADTIDQFAQIGGLEFICIR